MARKTSKADLELGGPPTGTTQKSTPASDIAASGARSQTRKPSQPTTPQRTPSLSPQPKPHTSTSVRTTEAQPNDSPDRPRAEEGHLTMSSKRQHSYSSGGKGTQQEKRRKSVGFQDTQKLTATNELTAWQNKARPAETRWLVTPQCHYQQLEVGGKGSWLELSHTGGTDNKNPNTNN